MIEAHLFVYGHRNQVNWSVWRFAALPASGDKIAVTVNGEVHDLVVRHVEHTPVSAFKADQPGVSVVADWQNSSRA